MDPVTTQAEQEFEEALENVFVLEPRSSYPDDDLLAPGEFDIA